MMFDRWEWSKKLKEKCAARNVDLVSARSLADRVLDKDTRDLLENAPVSSAEVERALRAVLQLDERYVEAFVTRLGHLLTYSYSERRPYALNAAEVMKYVKCALTVLHIWARTTEVKITPEMVCIALAPGTGESYLRRQKIPQHMIPNFFDLCLFCYDRGYVGQREKYPELLILKGFLDTLPFFRMERLLKGEAQPAPVLERIRNLSRSVSLDFREMLSDARGFTNRGLPTSPESAKGMARQLRKELSNQGVDIKLAVALEILAHSFGMRDWNTLHAVLSRKVRAVQPDADHVLKTVMCLDDPDPARFSHFLTTFLIADMQRPGNDLWKNRAISYLNSALIGVHFWAQETGVKITPDMIRSVIHLGDGTKYTRSKIVGSMREPHLLDICHFFYDRGYMGSGSRNGAALVLRSTLSTLPGFSLQRLLEGRDQESRTVEQAGFLTMQLTKPLGLMIDAARAED